MICSMCQRSNSTSYFRIARVTAGSETPLTLLCSVPCAIRWFYKYAQMSGMMLAVKAKSAFDQFIDGLKNLQRW